MCIRIRAAAHIGSSSVPFAEVAAWQVLRPRQRLTETGNGNHRKSRSLVPSGRNSLRSTLGRSRDPYFRENAAAAESFASTSTLADATSWLKRRLPCSASIQSVAPWPWPRNELLTARRPRPPLVARSSRHSPLPRCRGERPPVRLAFSVPE